MRKALVVFFLLIHSFFTHAAGEFITIGAQEGGIGVNSVAISNAYSANNNQAAMAFLEGPAFGLFYLSNYTTLGINTFAASGAYPVKNGAVGLTMNYSGYSAYNEMKVGVSYAQQLAKYLAISAQLDLLSFRIQGLGSKIMPTFEIGIYAKPLEELTLGAHIYNPLKLTVDEEGTEYLPSLLRLGASYNVRKKALFSVEFVKNIRENYGFRAGIEYYIIDMLSLRVGFSTEPILGSFGIGIIVKENLRIDVASTYHQQLGFSPQIGISYGFKKK